MKDIVLRKIENNNRDKIKYFRTLETASELGLYINALANSGGGYIVIGVKDRFTHLEIKGIGADFRIKSTMKELQEYCDNRIYKVAIYQHENKRLIAIEVQKVSKKITYKGRRYIMGKNMQPEALEEKIFISHSSKDCEYGEAIVKLLRGLGVKRQQIIFTSNDDYGIPIGKNIFDYLKSQISEGAYMIYLLSDDYYKSVPCLNEMGAAWVVQNDYRVIGVPDFDFTNPNFSSGAIDPRVIGFSLDNKKRLVEFKNELTERFQLEVDEADWNSLLDRHLESL